MNGLKVLLVNSTFGGISGSGKHVQLLYDFLKDKVDFEVWNINTVGCIDIPKLKNLSFYIRCKFKRIPDDIDIIHVHNCKFAGVFKKDKVNVLTIHGSYENELLLQYGFLVKPVIWYIQRNLKKADVITCVDPYTAERTGWVWIPNMIDIASVDRIRPVKDSRLLWIGRDDPVKNLSLFKKLAEAIYRDYGVRSLALGIPEGRYEKRLWIDYKRVKWSEVIAYLKSAYLLVITSKVEGLPSTLLEAWASRCPVVSTPIPSLVKLNDLYGDVICVADSFSFEDVYRSVSSVVEERPHSMIERAYKVVSDNFDAKRVTQRYLDLYECLLRR